MAKATKKVGADDKFRFYQDTKGEHRWRRIAPNGREVGNSGEGYKRLSACKANARRMGWDGKED